MTNDNLLECLEALLRGAQIPKPEAEQDYTVKGLGKTRGETALVHYIPGESNSEKRIPFSAFKWADEQLTATGEMTSQNFAKKFPDVENDGHCNYTSLGGIFVLLGKAEYAGDGVYRKKEN